MQFVSAQARPLCHCHKTEYIGKSPFQPKSPTMDARNFSFCQNTLFQKLEVLEFINGLDEAYVTFKAHLIQNNLKKILFEKSYFLKIGPQWLYKCAIPIDLK